MSAVAGIARRRMTAAKHFLPVLVVFVAVFAILSVWQGSFFTIANLRNLLTGISVLWVVSLGQTFAVISGGLDLSVGAISTLVAIFLAKVLAAGLPVGAVIASALVFGALVGGLVNGVLIGKARLSFFVVTLASMTALTGVDSLWSNTQTFYVSNHVIGNIGFGSLGGVPTAIWVMLTTFLILLWVQTRSYFGRDVYAVGGSYTASRLSGIRTGRTVIVVYALCGMCAALGGIIATGRIGAASPQVDPTLPLNAAAAVLLGGTLLSGGSGGIGGTAIGVLFIGTLQNGLSIAGIPSFWQQVVTGIILVVAVAGGGQNLVALRAAVPWRHAGQPSGPSPELTPATPGTAGTTE